MKRSLFILVILFCIFSELYSQVSYSGAAVYGLRKIIPAYSGNAIQVRRTCDGATGNIGFTTCGDLDTTSLKNFVLVANPVSAMSSVIDAVYSLRKMRCAYAGNAIEVRRSSDNTTSNIGFTALGDLDTVALKAFVGAGNGFIRTWYDQSANGYNVTQTTNALQPRIVSAGVVDRPNGTTSKPSIYFDGTDDYMVSTAYNRFLNSQTPTWNAVIFPKATINAYAPIVSWRSAGSVCSQLEIAGSNNWNNCWWSNNVNWTTTNGQTRTYDAYQIVTHFIQATASQLYYNGTLSYNNTGQANGPAVNTVLHTGTPMNMGVDVCCGGRYIKGYLNEVVLASTNISATDRQYLEWSQAQYYGVSGPVLTTLPASPASASVAIWYDQSGNGINLAPTGATTRYPQIMNAGYIVRQNGSSTWPAIQGTTGSQTNLTAVFGTAYAGNVLSVNSVLRSDIGTTANLRVVSAGNSALTSADWSSADYFNINQRTTNQFVFERNGVAPNTVFTVGSPLVLSGTFNATNRQLFNNGTASATQADANSFNFNSIRLLQSINPAFEAGEALTGKMSEFGLYYSALSTTRRRLIETNQSAYYNITISNSKYTAPTTSSYNKFVLGIGRESIAPADSVCATRQSAGMGFTVSTNAAGYLKDNGDYICAGMDCPLFTTSTSNIIFPVQVRWANDWYIDKTDVAGTTGGTVAIYFDFSDYNVSTTPGPAANYSLLMRPTNASNFAAVPSAIANVSGDRVYFTVDVNNITDLNYYTIGTTNPILSPLPVELTNFEAMVCEKDVCLDWKTASEINSDHFRIERSKDATVWEEIKTVKAAGNSQRTMDYSAVDYEPFNGINYYRLKLVDKNEEFKYSTIASVEFKEQLEVGIYPNPSTGKFNLSNVNAYDKIMVMDLIGRKVYEQTITKDFMVLDLNTLDNGSYFITLTNSVSNKKHTSRLVIEKEK